MLAVTVAVALVLQPAVGLVVPPALVVPAAGEWALQVVAFEAPPFLLSQRWLPPQGVGLQEKRAVQTSPRGGWHF